MRMKKNVVITLFAVLLLLLAGCAPEEKPPAPTSIPTPTPAPTFAMPEVPANTEEGMEAYASLSTEEQMAYHSIGRLVYSAAHISPGADYYEAIRAYVTKFMQDGGAQLPEGFTVSDDPGTALYFPGDEEGKSAPAAKFYATDFHAPEDGERVFASILELESGYLDGEDFPRYIARAVLVASAPKDTEYFAYDADGDGSLDYAFRFYVSGVPYEQSESECYIVHLKNWRFQVEPVTAEAWAEAKKGYDRNNAAYNMRQNVKKGVNLRATSLDAYNSLTKPFRGEGTRGTARIGGLYGGEASLTVDFLYRGGASSWTLALNTPGGVFLGGLQAEGTSYYTANIGCVDLTGDGREEIIFHVEAHEGAGSNEELHVFTQSDGAIKEILTVCDGNPEEKQTQYASSYFLIPNGFTYKNGAKHGDFESNYTRATCITTEGINVLRITSEIGDQTAQTYLWYNGEKFETVYQVVFK